MDNLASHVKAHGRHLLAGLLVGLGPLSTALATGLGEPATAQAITIPTAHWDGSGVRVEVSASAGASVNAQSFPALAHYAVGVVAMPVTLLNPVSALGLPFYMLMAAPWQAGFNAQRAALVQGLATVPLPQATVDALRAQWPSGAPKTVTDIHLHIDSYGLRTRSGRSLDAFDESKEDLCLVALTQLRLARNGKQPYDAPLTIALQPGSAGEPPALCAPLARWASNDATLLRQGILELAEVLAALTLQRLEEAP